MSDCSAGIALRVLHIGTRSRTHRAFSNEKYPASARCAPTWSLGIPVPAHATDSFSLTADTQRLAFAFPGLREDALGCIPGESDASPVAAGGGWPPAAVPLPVSTSDACAHVFRSAPDALRRCALARSPA